MRRHVVAAAAFAVLVGCGGSGTTSTAASSTSAAPAGDDDPAFAWISKFEGVEGPLTRIEDYQSDPVWIDEVGQTVYAYDCRTTSALTGDGGRYGALRADQPGGPAMGYGSVCQRATPSPR